MRSVFFAAYGTLAVVLVIVEGCGPPPGNQGESLGSAQHLEDKINQQPSSTIVAEIKEVPLGPSDASALPGEYQLFVREPPSQWDVFPAECQLVLTRFGTIERTVQSINDLRGFVNCSSRNGAVAFDRLLTYGDPFGYYVEGNLGLEIVANGKLRGCEKYGAIEPNVFSKLQWHPFEIHREAGVWAIQRFVFRWTGIGTATIAKVDEQVTDDGSYRLLAKRTIYSGKIGGVTEMISL